MAQVAPLEGLVSRLVYFTSMARQLKTRKITVEVSEALLKRASRAGEGVTEVVRGALELRAAQGAWQRMARWSGKVTWSVGLEELRKD